MAGFLPDQPQLVNSSELPRPASWHGSDRILPAFHALGIVVIKLLQTCWREPALKLSCRRLPAHR